MKQFSFILALLLVLASLAGCAVSDSVKPSVPPAPGLPEGTQEAPATDPVLKGEIVTVALSDSGISVDGGGETKDVFTSHDIIYYEDRDSYDSGNPYGEGELTDRHSADEAAAHMVVNITAPGNYRLCGKLSHGQIRIDLGEKAHKDETAVVNLILDGADITCTVAPAILFLNVYECDADWSEDTATPQVDTTAAGANLILAANSRNTVNGAYVARIYKDKEGEKKLWKQDGAIYSYMSMNVSGTGTLDINAENEGLDTELHLTINSGNLNIRAGNDGINTNEDGVSVTTINGGTIHIIAGLGAEGDGIDSNGYLVINGGTVVSSAHPASDAGLDSDLGSFVNGGTVIAMGATMDWAESDSDQVTMNLQFAAYQDGGAAVVVTLEDGTVVFAYDPSEDEVLADNMRRFQGAVISSPYFTQGASYHVYLDGQVEGSDTGGVYDVTTVTGYTDGVQQSYTGSDLNAFGPGGHRPGNFGGGEPPEKPEGEPPKRPEGNPPEGFGGEEKQPPEGFPGQRPGDQSQTGQPNTLFYMQDKVNAFTGLAPAE